MRKFIKWLAERILWKFCRHDYVKTGWQEAEENGVRYSMRFYTCAKCGRNIMVDGRCDPYAR